MLHAKDGIRINSVNPGYVLTDVFGEGTSASPVALLERQALWLCCAVYASTSFICSRVVLCVGCLVTSLPAVDYDSYQHKLHANRCGIVHVFRKKAKSVLA